MNNIYILKDGSDKTGKVLSTVLAAESPIFTGDTMMTAAIGANNVLLIADTPTILNDGLLAFCF